MCGRGGNLGWRVEGVGFAVADANEAPPAAVADAHASCGGAEEAPEGWSCQHGRGVIQASVHVFSWYCCRANRPRVMRRVGRRRGGGARGVVLPADDDDHAYLRLIDGCFT